MAAIETWLNCDLKKAVPVKQLPGNLFSLDNGGNLIGVSVTKDGKAASLSGNVIGYIIRDDGQTVIAQGTLSGNKASVVLPLACYTVVGPISIVIKLGTTTIGACRGYVYRSRTDVVVDPDSVIPTLEDLLAQIGDMRTATSAAETAAGKANSAATQANGAANNASSASGSANTAATAANNAARSANTAASAANSAKLSADTATKNANDAASAAKTAKDNADTAAQNANDAATAANTAKGNADAATEAANTAKKNADDAAAAANTAAAETSNIDIALVKTGNDLTVTVTDRDGKDTSKTIKEPTATITRKGEIVTLTVTDANGTTDETVIDPNTALNMLQAENIPGTIQKYVFSGGNVQKVIHQQGETAVRTDVFTYSGETITETRTLATGEKLEIVTNLSTLETTTAYTAA